MKKINYSSTLARSFYLIASLMPIFLFLFLRFKLNWLIDMEFGSIFLFCFWFIILLIVVYYNCLDVDIYIKSKKIIVKPTFKDQIIVNGSFQVKSLSILTMFFNVYLFKVNNRSFIFKSKPISLRGFSSFSNNAKKIEDTIREEVS